MCLVKVKQEEDVVVPYRVVKRDRSPRRSSHYSTQRVSRTEVIHDHSPRPSASYVAVPAPKPLAIPAPQPVPVFVQPSPPPPPMPMPQPHHHHHAHYVEVSPQSSVTSYSPPRSEYVTREREYRRERNYSPDSPRYEHFRYVEPAPSESDHYDRYERRRSRSRVRERSRSRAREYDHDPRGSYRETNERITIVDNGGRRRREYRS